MIRLEIKNPDDSLYGFVVLKGMDEAQSYIAECKNSGAAWTTELWTILEDGDERIKPKTPVRIVVDSEEVPAVEEIKDSEGKVIQPGTPLVPAKTHKEYNLGCYIEIIDVGVEPLLVDIRAERNKKLSECDWTQLSDSPLSNEKLSEWVIYRKALRNLPNSEGFDPENVIWPEPPLK